MQADLSLEQVFWDVVSGDERLQQPQDDEQATESCGRRQLHGLEGRHCVAVPGDTRTHTHTLVE